MLKPLRHRLFTLLATLMFIGCLHSATLDERHMEGTLQPALSALSCSMLDIREVLTRCSKEREGEEEQAYESSIKAEVRHIAGDTPKKIPA